MQKLAWSAGLAFCLVAAGCGDDSEGTTAGEDARPMVDTAIDRAITVDAAAIDVAAERPLDGGAPDLLAAPEAGAAERPADAVAGETAPANPDSASPDASAQDASASEVSASEASVPDASAPDVAPDVAACTATCTTAGPFCVDEKTLGSCALVDGCPTAGNTTTCPGVQICGGAAGAASCQCPAEGVAVGAGCANAGDLACAGAALVRCQADPASGCRIWAPSVDCAAGSAAGLACATQQGGACQCPAPTNDELHVDPVAGSSGGSVVPTGAAEPPACRFRTIGSALAALGGRAARIVATGTAPVTLSGESFPLNIPAGATLTTAGGPPANYQIQVTSTGATPGIVLGGGATLSGFTLTHAGGGSSMTSTLVRCSAGQVTIQNVALVGGEQAGTGISVASSCSATLANVEARRLEVGASLATTGMVTVNASSFSEGNLGVVVDRGARVVATALVAENNRTDGLQVSNGEVTVTGASRFDGNQRDGVRMGRGAFTATGLQANRNKVCGVNARGGTVKLHRVTLNDNFDLGLLTIGAVTSIDDGSAVFRNGASGIRWEGGELSVGAAAGDPVEIGDNGYGFPPTLLYAINADGPGAGARITVTRTRMFRNSGFGIKALFTGTDGKMTVTDSDIFDNDAGGVLVRRTESTTAEDSLVLDNVRIYENGAGGQSGIGVWVRNNNGGSTTTVRRSIIRDNGDVGVLVDRPMGTTTRITLDGNEIFRNNGTAGRDIGGVQFTAPATLTAFTANKVFGNGGDEIGFSAPPATGTAWVLGGPTASCATPATINQIYCYGAGRVGIRVDSPTPTTVEAPSISWQNATPSAGVDFAVTGGNTLLASSPCAATTTCP